jgi:predicted transcriptional regulator
MNEEVENKEEQKQKFLPALIGKIKYSRKVKVADIKQYLVDEYKLTDTLNKENKKLREDLEEADVTRQKYELALITLDEYKKRINNYEKDIKDLEDKIETIKEEKNDIINERNDLKIKSRDFLIAMETEKDNAIEQMKKDLVKIIENTKGSLVKADMINKIKKYKLKKGDE